MKSLRYYILFFLFPILFLNGCTSSRPDPATPYDGADYIRESELLSYDLADYETIPTNPNGSLSVPTYITISISSWTAITIRSFTTTI